MSASLPTFTPDRALRVAPGQVVRTAWVRVDRVRLANRTTMVPEAVEKKWRGLLQLGDDQAWPPPNGYWEAGTFVILDGRHEYVAALMLGRERVLVAWVSEEARDEG